MVGTNSLNIVPKRTQILLFQSSSLVETYPHVTVINNVSDFSVTDLCKILNLLLLTLLKFDF